ncbi:MAG: DUF6516 family protein [Thermodesulfobacteriota bacterium]|nr:DUF6516 family protein [Thermodesulfobacteriota bacterium]
MTIQVATKFPVSNFKFPDIAREKSLRGSNILNPKNIILRTIVFYNGDILEFTESITPARIRYRYHYMNGDGALIFRYDNVPHHTEISTFPHHKHLREKIVGSSHVDLRQVVEEVIENIVT